MDDAILDNSKGHGEKSLSPLAPNALWTAKEDANQENYLSRQMDTITDWDDPKVDFVEMGLVAHHGVSALV